MIIDGYTAYVVKDTPTGTAKAKSYNVPVMQGWVCPLCGRGLSPYVSVCPCKGVKMDITCQTVERKTDE